MCDTAQWMLSIGASKAFGVAAVAAVLIVSGAALSIAVADDESAPRPSAGSDPVGRIAPELPQLIAAFRREQDSSDRLPGDPDAAIETGDRQPGESPALARRLGAANGRAIYVWPATDSVCLSHAWSGGCIPTDILARQGAVVGTRFLAEDPSTGAPVRQAFVLARDGVNEVEIVTANGAPVTADTRGNAAVVDLPADAVTAVWENADGTRGTQRLEAPVAPG